jgi:DNA-binding transcriptional regulator YiaG
MKNPPGRPVKPASNHPAPISPETIRAIIEAENSNISDMANRLQVSRKYLTDAASGKTVPKRILQLALTAVFHRLKPLE